MFFIYSPEFLIEILTHFIIIEYLDGLNATFYAGVYLSVSEKIGMERENRGEDFEDLSLEKKIV